MSDQWLIAIACANPWVSFEADIVWLDEPLLRRPTRTEAAR